MGLIMPNIKWTNESPKVPGYYWWTYKQWEKQWSSISLVRITEIGIVEFFDGDDKFVETLGGVWYGPIEITPPPHP